MYTDTRIEKPIEVKMNGTYDIVTIVYEKLFNGERSYHDIPVAPWGSKYAMKRAIETKYRLTW